MTATFKVAAAQFKTVKKWGNKRIPLTSLKSLWDEIGNDYKRRTGVYVFGVNASKGAKPLYLGMTIDQTFERRIYQHIYHGTFNRYLKGIKRGSPRLFLLGRMGKGRRSTAAIDALEIELINYCFDKNNRLHNRRRIKRPVFSVQGFGRGGGKRPAVKDLKKMIGW
jgi:hypothetical protein